MCLLLIDKIKKARSKADAFTLLQCFGQMARTVGNKVSQHLNDVFPLLFQYAQQLNRDQSIDIDNEITEVCLSTFETLVRKCPREVAPYIDKMLELSFLQISYDPNYTYDDNAGDGMEDDEEGGWGSDFEDDNMGNDDDDDTSWKVRRAAARTIEAVIGSRPELLRTIYEQHARSIVARFKERDDNVKCNVLEVFQQLLKSTQSQSSNGTSSFASIESDLTTPSLNRASSVQNTYDLLAQLVPLVVDTLVKQLKSKNLKVRVSVMQTLSQLASTASSSMDQQFAKFLPELEKALNDQSGYELVLDTLAILRKLFRGSKNSQSYQENH